MLISVCSNYGFVNTPFHHHVYPTVDIHVHSKRVCIPITIHVYIYMIASSPAPLHMLAIIAANGGSKARVEGNLGTKLYTLTL